MDERERELELKKLQAVMSPAERKLHNKLMGYDLMLDNLLVELEHEAPDIARIVEEFDPLEMGEDLDEADNHPQFFDLKHSIETKGQQLMDALGLIDYTNVENKTLVKNVEGGPARRNADHNSIEREVLVIWAKRFAFMDKS